MTTALRLVTRGSALARTQAASVQGALVGRRLGVELVEVETTDDRVQDKLTYRPGKIGAFVRALNERVLNGEVDAAIRSMKDMPTEEPADLVVTGASERALAGDVFVTAEGHDIDDPPEGAVAGTSSLRQQAQPLNYHDDLEVEPLRGNVDTYIERPLTMHLQCEHEARVENDKERQGKKGKAGHDEAFDEIADEWFKGPIKLERQALGRQVEIEYDVIVLAKAGLRRSGLTEKVSYECLPRTTSVPALGQGAIAVTATDSVVIELIRDKLDHPQTRVETTVEWTILMESGGSYIAPVGVHTFLQGEHIHVDMQVLATDGPESIKTSHDLPVGNHVDAAREFVVVLCDRGAGQLVDAAREEAEE